MKKRLLRSMICFLLAVIMITESNLGTITAYASEVAEDTVDSEEYVEEEEEFIPTASSYLYPFEEALMALEEVAANRVIQGVVYLEDEVILRVLPEESSEPVRILYSGDVVSIVSVGQDAEYNIWYKVTYKTELEEVSGYIRKDYIACVDEEFTKWQDNYVRSIGMFSLWGNRYSHHDIEAFPESYQEKLTEIKEAHPNWMFVKMNTGIYWNVLVREQLGDRSLISSSVKESWKNGSYGQPGWSYASEGILKYFLDPRNFLNTTDIFQFELLGFYSEYHTVEAVEDLLAGTFMANKTLDNGKTYAQTFVELGRITGVSPFMIASRVRQEQGAKGTSPLISGNYEGCDGAYKGYYNYFNIGASGNSDKQVIESGLKTAKENGWDSQYKALKGGADFLVKGYINAGQDTLYLQKFDVDNRYNGIFWHQYMQNIRAPYYEARSVYNTYKENGLLEQPFIFRIPVYTNMSSVAAVAPGDEDVITLSSTSIDNLQVDKEITLRPYVNGKEPSGTFFEFTSSDPSIATVDNNGVVKALKAGEVTITCANAEDKEYTKAGTCKIRVIQTNIDMSTVVVPELEAITYDPNATLSSIELPGGYSWVNPDMVPVVTQAAYGVTYNPDPEKYNAITFDIALEVKKRSYTSAEYTIPTGLEGGATRELSSVMLPNGFMWNDPSEKLADIIGTKEYLASFNLDANNYETVCDIKIPVKIICEKHNYSQWEITEATCDKDGLKTRKCTICDSKEELVLDKLGHNYEAVVTTEPTEEAEGVRTYTCSRCEDSYTESIPKLPSTHVHAYDEIIVKKASCTENGVKELACSCGDKYTEVITATGHKMENGLCEQCGYTEAVETPKEEETQKPSVEEDKKEETNTPPVEEDKKEETNTPPVEEDKKEETNTPPVEEDKKEEITKQPEVSEDKKEETIKQPEVSEDKKEEITKQPEVTEDKKEETVKQPTENKVELELMSNLVEKAENETEDGEKKTIAIQLNKNTEISQKIVEMAKEHGVDLEVSLPNELKWTIKADSLGDQMPSSINMNAQIVQEVIEQEVINTVVSEEEYIELSLSHDGTFGFEATLTVPVEKKHIGKTANLFYFNEKVRELEFVMAAPVNEDGNVLLDFNHASDYVIVFAEKSMEDAVNMAETITDVAIEETVADEKQDKKDSINHLITICMIILLVSGGIALIGFFLCKHKEKPEEIVETNTFEEWLKEEPDRKVDLVKENKEYFDDDKDDYREKEVQPGKTFHTGEIHLEEDYLDEDVDDYQER